MRLHDLLEVPAHDRPGATALRNGTSSMTYGELQAAAESSADALVGEGLRPGDPA